MLPASSLSSFVLRPQPTTTIKVLPSPQSYVISTMRTSSSSGPINMCRLLIHKYSCGHSKTDVAPCAGHRGGGCSGTTEKTVTHKEKCARCGKCQCPGVEWRECLANRDAGLSCREPLRPLRHQQWLIIRSSSHGPSSKLVITA